VESVDDPEEIKRLCEWVWAQMDQKSKQQAALFMQDFDTEEGDT
jgi:hypothetical protein